MIHENINDLDPVLDSALIHVLAENVLGPCLVPARIEIKFAAIKTIRHTCDLLKPIQTIVLLSFDHFRGGPAVTLRIGDLPSCKGFGDFYYVFLCIAAIYPECMQFHKLAGVVFIDSSFPPLLICLWISPELFQTLIELSIINSILLPQP